MSFPPRYAHLAGRLLSEQDVEDPVLPADVRDRTIGAMVAAMRQQKRRRQWTRSLLMAAGLLPLGLGLSLWLTSLRHPSPAAIVALVSGEGAKVLASSPQHADGHLHDGDLVVAGTDSAANVALSTGTQMSLAADGQVRMAEGARRWLLERGRVQLAVAPLPPGETFVVETSDARVSVHGTFFSVALATPDPTCGQGTRTRVSVAEGLVEVAHGSEHVRLGAGESWPSGCAAAAPSSAPDPSAQVPTPTSIGLDTHASESRHVGLPRGTTDAALSSLGLQNDLYLAAVRAKRSGDTVTALMRFNELLQRYPQGELAEAAEVERLRLLAQVDHTRATSAARSYLQRHPRGTARAEAEAILGGSPKP